MVFSQKEDRDCVHHCVLYFVDKIYYLAICKRKLRYPATGSKPYPTLNLTVLCPLRDTKGSFPCAYCSTVPFCSYTEASLSKVFSLDISKWAITSTDTLPLYLAITVSKHLLKSIINHHYAYHCLYSINDIIKVGPANLIQEPMNQVHHIQLLILLPFTWFDSNSNWSRDILLIKKNTISYNSIHSCLYDLEWFFFGEPRQGLVKVMVKVAAPTDQLINTLLGDILDPAVIYRPIINPLTFHFWGKKPSLEQNQSYSKYFLQDLFLPIYSCIYLPYVKFNSSH